MQGRGKATPRGSGAERCARRGRAGRRAGLLLILATLVPAIAQARGGPDGCLVGTPDGSLDRDPLAPDHRPEPVILIHGFASSVDLWRGTELVLRSSNFIPIAIPWAPEPGMRSPQAALQVVLPAIQRELEARGLEDRPVHLVGHSLGGVIARILAERPDADVDDPQRDGTWRGDGQPDGDGAFATRVRTVITLSTPHRGARTGLARAACDLHPDAAWRPLACDLTPGSPVLTWLGDGAGRDDVRYLAVGSSVAAPWLLAPPYDGDGDGSPGGHDNVVQAEAAHLGGARNATLRARSGGSHFDLTCTDRINEWIVLFLEDRPLTDTHPHRIVVHDICEER